MNFVIALALVAASCSSSSSTPAHKQSTDHYTVKGRITALPDGAASKQIEIFSERMPSFRSIDGKVAPMDAMAMPYAVGAVHLANVTVGDVVEAAFDVDWDATPPLILTRLDKLAQSTKLVGVP